jgi:hypothetical protein
VEQKEHEMFTTFSTRVAVAVAVASLAFVLVAASTANARPYVTGPYSTSTVKAIEVIGDHGRTDAQLSRAEVEAMRWQAMADFYNRKSPSITTEHSFGASKQRPVEPTVVSIASPDRFDWADAGIGASVGFATLLALSTLLVVARRSRTRLDNADFKTA